MTKLHFLLVTFPGQGHINPTLQFAERLIRCGIDVTFVTANSAIGRVKKGQLPEELTLASYTDGFDQGFSLLEGDINHYMSELRRHGSRTLKEYIASVYESEGRPRFTCVVYTLLLPWVSEVAREFHTPSALLWIQPSTVFDIYYYNLHGYGDPIRATFKDPSSSVKLPGLPPLMKQDLPSFFDPSSVHDFALPSMEEEFEALSKEPNPRVLVNTFDALEFDALRALSGRVRQIAVGPLVPRAILDGISNNNILSTCNSFRGDLFNTTSNGYMEWLNTKPEASVVYVSFGSMLVLSKEQKGEIARGLLSSGRPFLWVIRETKNTTEVKVNNEDEDQALSISMEELEKAGMVVSWCDQIKVLSHPAVGCFVTHCGWSSTLESLAAGVPVVAVPQWTDQTTNAKLIESAWGTGARASGLVRGEIERCLEAVMGEEGEEMRNNAKKWKELAREAVNEGGSSEVNLKDFVEELVRGSVVVGV